MRLGKSNKNKYVSIKVLLEIKFHENLYCKVLTSNKGKED